MCLTGRSRIHILLTGRWRCLPIARTTRTGRAGRAAALATARPATTTTTTATTTLPPTALATLTTSATRRAITAFATIRAVEVVRPIRPIGAAARVRVRPARRSERLGAGLQRRRGDIITMVAHRRRVNRRRLGREHRRETRRCRRPLPARSAATARPRSLSGTTPLPTTLARTLARVLALARRVRRPTAAAVSATVHRRTRAAR